MSEKTEEPEITPAPGSQQDEERARLWREFVYSHVTTDSSRPSNPEAWEQSCSEVDVLTPREAARVWYCVGMALTDITAKPFWSSKQPEYKLSDTMHTLADVVVKRLAKSVNLYTRVFGPYISFKAEQKEAVTLAAIYRTRLLAYVRAMQLSDSAQDSGSHDHITADSLNAYIEQMQMEPAAAVTVYHTTLYCLYTGYTFELFGLEDKVLDHAHGVTAHAMLESLVFTVLENEHHDPLAASRRKHVGQAWASYDWLCGFLRTVIKPHKLPYENVHIAAVTIPV